MIFLLRNLSQILNVAFPLPVSIYMKSNTRDFDINRGDTSAKLFRIISDFWILRLTFHRKGESQSQNTEGPRVRASPASLRCGP